MVLLPRGSPLGPFSDLGSPFVSKVPNFSILGLKTREKSVQPLFNVNHLITCDNKNFYLSTFMCLTEIQRFPLFFSRSRLISVKFVQNTLFWVPIASGEGPLKVAVHSKLGPHFDKFRSPFHVGAVPVVYYCKTAEVVHFDCPFKLHIFIAIVLG